jgi:hypothetical protein
MASAINFHASLGHPVGRPPRKTAVALWTVQAALAALFLAAGVSKLVMPAADLADQSSLPVSFLRFIGFAEALGAVGLILPIWLGIRSALTPLAAAGLAVIMVGATSITAVELGVAAALFPLAVGLLALLVLAGRRHLLFRAFR